MNVDHIPWKIIMQNTEGLATENSKVRIETMREYANNEKNTSNELYRNMVR